MSESGQIAATTAVRHFTTFPALRVGRRIVRCLPVGRMTAGRLVSWASRMGGRPIGCSFSDPPLYFVARLNEFIDAQMFYNGVFEPAVTSLVRDTLSPGQTFVDVGANSGYFSLLAWSLVRPIGRVIAFEPDPNSLHRLQANLSLNPGCSIEVLPLALSDREGISPFWGSSVGQANQGGGSLCEGLGPGGQAQTTSLDAYIDRLGTETVDLLKMDIEGAEGLALDGMQHCLREFRVQRLLLEMHRWPLERAGRSPDLIVGLLHALGYTGFRVRGIPTSGYRKYGDRGLHRCDRITNSDFAAPLAHYYFVCPPAARSISNGATQGRRAVRQT